MRHLLLCALAALTILVSLEASAQLVVLYDNLAASNYSWYPTAVNSNTDEFGDEITLAAGTPRVVDTFVMQYAGENFTGGIQIRFYANDVSRPDLGVGISEPGTVLYQSAVVPVTGLNGNATLTLSGLHVTVPDSFTWTVQFTGVTTGERAGVAIHGPPQTGSSYQDYWERDNSSWALYQFPTSPSNFGTQLTAVPEPTVTGMASALGLVLFASALRLRERM